MSSSDVTWVSVSWCWGQVWTANVLGGFERSEFIGCSHNTRRSLDKPPSIDSHCGSFAGFQRGGRSWLIRKTSKLVYLAWPIPLTSPGWVEESDRQVGLSYTSRCSNAIIVHVIAELWVSYHLLVRRAQPVQIVSSWYRSPTCQREICRAVCNIPRRVHSV